MAKLIAISPFADRLPIQVGALTLSEITPDNVTSISPFDRKGAAVSKALKSAFGFGFPKAGQAFFANGNILIWTGQGQAMLLGAQAPDLGGLAAVSEQSDGWAIVKLSGTGSEDTLARLVPVDLRRAVFKQGQTLRSMLQHMPMSITRTGENAFQIMVFRSMAGTCAHELEIAMRGVSARVT